jgi:hypothetical protein
MKSLLSITVAVFAFAPVLFAGEGKSSDKAKADCCEEKSKATACTSAKSGCCAKEAAAARVALLTHKGAFLAQR